MENGTYVSPPPLPPPPAAHLSAASAVVASSAQNVSQFQEALMSRMGRPFGLSSSEMKELHGHSFAAASLGLSGRNPGEGFSFPLLSHMGQPPFLHPVFDPRHPFSSVAAGAFRPIFGSHGVVTTSSSAFQTPTSVSSIKGRTSSPPVLFSPGQGLFPRNTSGSPGSPPSSSPPTSISSLGRAFKTDENSNTAPLLDRHESVSPISMDSSGHHDDEQRAIKKLRVSSGLESSCGCPICGMPLRSGDLESHYSQELEYLSKLSTALHLNQQQALKIARQQQQNSSPKLSSGIEVAPRSRWDTFQRIQRNRQSRIRVKLSRRAGKRPDEILEEEYQSRKQFSSQTEEDIDIVGDESPSRGGPNGGKDRANTSLSSEGSAHIYGHAQFTEADVLNCMNEENNSEVTPSSESPNEGNGVKREAAASPEPSNNNNNNNNDDSCASPTSTENIDALKEKLRQLEDHTKCAKCMNTLKSPVVNVNCWHIQCERCWLISLGTNKCCSQCGVSSHPQDLRRVYL